MSSICAWCGKSIEASATIGQSSLGICGECSADIQYNLNQPLGEFLNDIEIPIMLVDERGTVISGNNAVKRVLGLAAGEPDKRLVGEVIECRYAGDTASCGAAVHCNGCVIKQSISQAFETGLNVDSVPAFLETDRGHGICKTWYSISTRKMAGKVLLKIEPAEPPGDSA